MLAALLLAGLFAAPLSSAAMFVPVTTRWPAAGILAYSRRLVSAIVTTAALAAAGYGLSILVGTTSFRALIAAIVVMAFSVVLLPVTRNWNGRAHVCWATCTYLYLAYLVFIIHWTFVSNLGVGNTIGGVVLWLLEVVAGVFAGAYLWELCDALGTQYWRRRVTDERRAMLPVHHQPFVSLHVPAHNEPPEMVIQTLAALSRMNYPHYEIIAIDDNTEDPDLWRPVDEWCAQHGIKFAHVENLPGYKSGALNYALKNLTDPRAELIAVVDSDYQIQPDFLTECARLFADPILGFVQAPQDYRGWRQSSYYRRLYYSYRYFFAVSQPSRNERDAAIFAGTMGLIRRKALEDLGGWDEWC
ncbi:MAG: glycosyl transferase, family 2, partial [Jatrophihabitans sp.]|nr:glycosyl transferase, family 2 [Jatrophihabitans sp.]